LNKQTASIVTVQPSAGKPQQAPVGADVVVVVVDEVVVVVVVGSVLHGTLTVSPENDGFLSAMPQ
jgi:hypothetical protein